MIVRLIFQVKLIPIPQEFKFAMFHFSVEVSFVHWMQKMLKLQSKPGPDQKSDAVFKISPLPLPQKLIIYFIMPVNLVLTHFGSEIWNFVSKLEPNQKFDAIFKISDQRNPYFDNLFSAFPFKIQNWWYVRTFLQTGTNFYPKRISTLSPEDPPSSRGNPTT